MTSFVVNPRFSKEEMETIDEMVKTGTARNRADFVRTAALERIWALEKERE